MASTSALKNSVTVTRQGGSKPPEESVCDPLRFLPPTPWSEIGAAAHEVKTVTARWDGTIALEGERPWIAPDVPMEPRRFEGQIADGLPYGSAGTCGQGQSGLPDPGSDYKAATPSLGDPIVVGVEYPACHAVAPVFRQLNHPAALAGDQEFRYVLDHER